MDKPKIPVDLIIKHLAEEAGQVHERAQKASDILLGSLETEIATTPYEVVHEEDRVRLKHYLPSPGAKSRGDLQANGQKDDEEHNRPSSRIPLPPLPVSFHRCQFRVLPAGSLFSPRIIGNGRQRVNVVRVRVPAAVIQNQSCHRR